MNEVYVVLEYIDDVDQLPVSVLGVYTLEEQALNYMLTLVDQDSIGSIPSYVDPPLGTILDGYTMGDNTRRIAIVPTPFNTDVQSYLSPVQTEYKESERYFGTEFEL